MSFSVPFPPGLPLQLEQCFLRYTIPLFPLFRFSSSSLLRSSYLPFSTAFMNQSIDEKLNNPGSTRGQQESGSDAITTMVAC